jgi:hypothetical protein
MTIYRTELRAWLLDSLDFIIEQIELARSPLDRTAAIDAARRIVPFMESRLLDCEHLQTHFMLCFPGLMYDNNWEKNWNEIADKAAGEFTQSVNDLAVRVQAAKTVVETSPLDPALEVDPRK